MTDKNTAMMREVFKWLSKYEEPPLAPDEKWWTGFVKEGAAIYEHFPSPLTRNLIYGIIDGQEQKHKIDLLEAEAKRNAEGQQIGFDTTYGGENHGV